MHKWTITEEEVDYGYGKDKKKVTTTTSSVVEADRVEVQDGSLLFYDDSTADSVLLFATNHWDKVSLVTEE